MLSDFFKFKFMGKDLAIDLGTTNTVIFKKGNGIVLNAPSVLAVDKRNKKVLGVGTQAKQMLGKTPKNIVAIRPLKDGVVADFDITKQMLEYFIHQVQPGKMIIGPRLVIGVPSKATKVEKRALVDIAKELGAKKTSLVEEPVAAVVGAELPISEPMGHLVLDIGGGTSEAAITSLNGVVISNSIRIAGDELDQAIVQYIKEKYNLFIGEQMAEKIKITLGYIPQSEQEDRMKIRGRELEKGLPREIEISSQEMEKALNPVITAIVDMLEQTLEQCPPELAGDVMENGVYLAGGGAYLKGLDVYIAKKVNLSVNRVAEPLLVVALGLGKLLDNNYILSAVEVTPSDSY